ncbi:TIM barrel protein [Patescibacteria group bacterium]|nr:TIM barrel protein [Patescibacteria group bacterium]
MKALKNYNKLAGICLDTQHSFASGYDWKNEFEKNIKLLDKNIGLKNVKLIHANDSASDCGSRKDRHEHIGKGKIGIDGFKNITQFAKKQKIDLICETDYPGVITDIQTLKKLLK